MPDNTWVADRLFIYLNIIYKSFRIYFGALSAVLFVNLGERVWAQDRSCDISILHTDRTLNREAQEGRFCIADYFAQNNLNSYRLNYDTPDDRWPFALYYKDQWLFSKNVYQAGETFREKIIKKILENFLDSIKVDNGVCELKIYGNGRLLGPQDYRFYARLYEQQQPGNRWTLESEDYKGAASWVLECPNQNNQMQKVTEGHQFLIFIDVYEYKENIYDGPHYAQFLMALKK